MGKLKPKAKAKAREPKESPQSEAVPSSSGIFNTLFGDATDDQNAAVSIFSESNPYRRKPQESLGFAPAESLRSPNDVVSENPNLDGEPKKKRNRGKENNPNPNLDSYTIFEDSEAPFGAKKAKEEKPQKPNLGAESNGALEGDKGRNPNLASGSNGPSKKDKGKKPQNPNLENEKDRKPNLGSESDGALKKNEGNGSKLGPKSDGVNTILGAKKKRKRDELEREYEAKKYGVAAEEEEREKKKLVGEKRKTVDNVEDLVVSPEGYDDESKLLRTVFVGNLPLKVKKKALVKEFKQFGEVESVRIRSVPILDTKRPRKEAIITKQINETADSVHAYIVFKTEESTKASLSHNMAVVGGNHIRVDRACPPRKKLKGENDSLYDNKRTVFVGNLPYDAKDEELYRLFSGIDNVGSSIEAIRVIRHPQMHLGKGIAYVLFKTREAANLVVKKRNLKLRDRELRVFHATKSSTPSKRSNPSSAQAANSPAKRLALDPRTPENGKRASMKAPPPVSSYQGLRASKSGVQKKVHQEKRKFVRPGSLNSKSQKGVKPKERQGKRPSVAARKAKANVLKDGGASRGAGIKRKLDSRTPESFQRNKKAKKFK